MIPDGSWCEGRMGLEEMPSKVLELIVGLLPVRDLESCGGVCKSLQQAANSVARRRFSQLYSDGRLAMESWRLSLTGYPLKTRAYLPEVASLQRKLYLMETVLAEMNVIRVVCRMILVDGRGNACCIAKILEQLLYVYNKSYEDDLPVWAPDNYFEKKMQDLSKSFIEAKVAQLNVNRFFGCQLLDLLDILMDHQYKIDVLFNPIWNLCVIDGIYKLESPKYICRPPILEDQEGEIPTLEDKLKIYKYLLNLLSINQRVILRQEQYFREFETSTENSALIWMSKEGKDRSPRLHRNGVEIREQENYHVLRAAYSSEGFLDSAINDQGFVCFVHLICPLDAGPLSVLDAWQDLKRALADDSLPVIGGEMAARDLLRVISMRSSQLSARGRSQTESYTFGCTFEAAIRTSQTLQVSTLVFHEP